MVYALHSIIVNSTLQHVDILSIEIKLASLFGVQKNCYFASVHVTIARRTQ